MPPLRTTPSVVKKTERTHEENQERAYIAASRRSDRSLEARVESARRASEIHKKRTGRALRITEQDVINEEMYEEEDDDLPLHYRLLQHQLRTDSTEFNRRYLAYMTSQLSVRSALDQAYAQYFPNYDNVVNGGRESAMYMNPLGQAPLRSPPANMMNFPGSPYPLPRRQSGTASSVARTPSTTLDSAVSDIQSAAESSHNGSAASSQVTSPVLAADSLNRPPFFPYRPPFAAPGVDPQQQQQQFAMFMAAQQQQIEQLQQEQRQLDELRAGKHRRGQQQELVQSPQALEHSSPQSPSAESPTKKKKTSKHSTPNSTKVDAKAATSSSPFTRTLSPATQQFLTPFLDPTNTVSASLLAGYSNSGGEGAMFSPSFDGADSMNMFGDSVSVYPTADHGDLFKTSTAVGAAATDDDDAAALDLQAQDDSSHDEAWNFFINEWEGSTGSQA